MTKREKSGQGDQKNVQESSDMSVGIFPTIRGKHSSVEEYV